jgi:ubiquinone/menaquinone biosynthesis C-methylase UbiE
MVQKPKHLASQYGQQFKDGSIVKAYQYRPPYSSETFDILVELLGGGQPRTVLDVGCGTGSIARYLAERVEHVDAVDFSQPMLEWGRQLANGDHAHLRWVLGSVEDVDLVGPYGLITAGESLHWMDWNVVLPRFSRLLKTGAYLAIVGNDMQPLDWYDILGDTIKKYSTNRDFQYYDMIGALERYGLFQKKGEKTTKPIPFIQSIDDYIESFHSRNGFSRERMEPAMAEAFDREVREQLLRAYPDGYLSLQITATIVWGVPLE